MLDIQSHTLFKYAYLCYYVERQYLYEHTRVVKISMYFDIANSHNA